MYPILFTWGPLQLHTYAVTMAMGFMAGILLGNYRVEKRGIDLQKVLNLEVVLILAGIGGSRLMFVILEWDWYRNHLLDIPLFWKGGLVYYGGFLVALVSCLAYCRIVGLPMLQCSDIAAPSVVVGQFFGRIGCLFGGCCYGAVTDLPWGMRFPATTNDNLKHHPTQIYEMALLAAIFAILHRYYDKKDRSEGTVMVMYGYLYGIARFTVEIWRGDDRGGFFFGGFSIGQCVSVAVIVVALGAHAFLVWLHRRAKAREFAH
ncbi:MAG: prolipoprotein diacylglyceryl transferase [Candidatus Wallbacteria bacterium]|nr:prolipoprotein diacylglyceryl transferase [Candidatus Wallbacteria bacterium]